MITGFNTDIEYEGVVYHVQTEDKGLDTPIILSLVYSGGAILASKRSPYEDLIESGYSDEALAERLKRQHRLICAAIHTGRLNDLRKMSGRDVDVPATETLSSASETVEETPAEETHEEIQEETPAETRPSELELEFGSKRSQEYQPPAPLEEETVEEDEPKKTSKRAAGSYRIAKQQGEEEEEETVIPPTTAKAGVDQALVVRLLDEVEFYSGETATVRVLVTSRDGEYETPLQNVAVSVKVLGTTFRPLIYSLKTQRNGIATVSTQIPRFSSGRAAVLIRATAKDQAAEVRCIIHPTR